MSACYFKIAKFSYRLSLSSLDWGETYPEISLWAADVEYIIILAYIFLASFTSVTHRRMDKFNFDG